jgi:hypothetical protein
LLPNRKFLFSICECGHLHQFQWLEELRFRSIQKSRQLQDKTKVRPSSRRVRRDVVLKSEGKIVKAEGDGEGEEDARDGNLDHFTQRLSQLEYELKVFFQFFRFYRCVSQLIVLMQVFGETRGILAANDPLLNRVDELEDLTRHRIDRIKKLKYSFCFLLNNFIIYCERNGVVGNYL